MAMIIANEGKQLILRRALNYVAADDCKLKLYKNDVTPGETNTTATFTEADFTGYANKTLTGASWTVTSADPAVATYAVQEFTSSAGSQNQPVYGWYMTNNAGNILIAAERFGTTPTIVNNGDKISVTPDIDCDTI